MMKKLAIVTLLLLMTAACASPPQEPSTEHAAQTGGQIGMEPSETEAEDNKQAEVQESETDQPDDTDQEGVGETVEEPLQEEPSAVEKAYYINKIYDVKPLDESVESQVVLLTFDDGPKDEEMVHGLLDTLDKHQAKAIFFVNGFRVKANPELLQLIHERGHAIGNHSWDHINLKKESEESIRQQIDDVQQIVAETIGESPRFFRPPHGAYNEYLLAYVAEQDMIFMNWSNGSLDWDRDNQTPEAVIANVLEQLRPGSNILMHELPWTVEALDELLTKLDELGYGFVNPHAIQSEPPIEETAG